MGVLGAYEDVTERVQAERALLESERRFQAFMDRTPVYAYIKGRSAPPRLPEPEGDGSGLLRRVGG